jgi:hypothetical protein
MKYVKYEGSHSDNVFTLVEYDFHSSFCFRRRKHFYHLASDGRGLENNIFDSLWHQWYKFGMNYHERTEKNNDHFLDFLFAHVCFLLSWRLWRVPFLTLPHGFAVVFENSTFVTLYDPSKKIWFSFEPFSISADTSFRPEFWSSFTHFETIFSNNFLMFKSCVTIWWAVH